MIIRVFRARIHPGKEGEFERFDHYETADWDLVPCLDLDTPSKRPVSGRPVTLRWILFHLVEETARHNGHLVILRELADA